MGILVVNSYLGYATIALQIATVAAFVIFFLRNRIGAFQTTGASIGAWGLWIAFGVSFVASLLTLYYSEVLGVEPCPLCWWQRIFLYPQVILLGLAAWKRDSYMTDYSIVLSICGAGVALYQHALQMMPGSGLPCPATGVSCAQRILFEFGYITYPLMAFSLFTFLIVIMLFVRARREV
jgi:disulfide bond formation protein DsbB